MEPVDPGSNGAAWPSPTAAAPRSAPIGGSAGGSAGASSAARDVSLLPMMPWRLVGAVALVAAFALMGWQVWRVVDDRPWSDSMMAWSLVAGAVAGLCVLGWTWSTVDNARRLVEPATTMDAPNPWRATAAWIGPFGFVALAAAAVAYVGEQTAGNANDSVSSAPLAVAAVALLLAIPMTYRPLFVLAGVVRRVGGYTARLAQWMWVPVVLAVVGVGSIVALHLSGAAPEADGAADDLSSWAPLWLVAAVAIVPCVIVVLLAGRAAGAVEEAVQLAADRRRGASTVRTRPMRLTTRHPAAVVQRGRVRLIPGADLVRLTVVTLLAGLALLSTVGAVVMFLFWLDADGGELLPAQRARAWDALGVLDSGARVVGLALIGAASIWTFIAVANVRMASGVRRNPVIAALSWPLAAWGGWMVAERFVVDQDGATVALGFALQAALLVVPLGLLERAAGAVGARRVIVRIAYLCGVVLLVVMQTLGGMTSLEGGADANVGRVAGLLALVALLQLLSTLAITEVCRSIEVAAERAADAHNARVDSRQPASRPAAESLHPLGAT